MRNRLLKQRLRRLRDYGRKRSAICRFFGIDSSKRELTSDEALSILRKLGSPVSAAYIRQYGDFHYSVYVPYRIVGVWPVNNE